MDGSRQMPPSQCLASMRPGTQGSLSGSVSAPSLKSSRSRKFNPRSGEQRPTFRSPYAFQGPDTGVPLPSWLYEGSSSGDRSPDADGSPTQRSIDERPMSMASSRGLMSSQGINFPVTAAFPARSAPPPARWWLQEPRTGMQSLGKGLFEITTGIVVLWSEPTSEAETVGSIRSGTRFNATPRQFRGSTWLEVQTRGAPPPLFNLDHAEAATAKQFAERDGDSREVKLYKSSCRTALVQPEVGTTGAWVEYNKQYIHRIRDVGRERGAINYSSLNFHVHAPKVGIRDWLRKRARMAESDDESD